MTWAHKSAGSQRWQPAFWSSQTALDLKGKDDTDHSHLFQHFFNTLKERQIEDQNASWRDLYIDEVTKSEVCGFLVIFQVSSALVELLKNNPNALTLQTQMLPWNSYCIADTLTGYRKSEAALICDNSKTLFCSKLNKGIIKPLLIP